MNWDSIIFEIVNTFIRVGVVYGAYAGTKELASKTTKPIWAQYLIVAGVAFAVAIFIGSNFGEPPIENIDSYHGGGLFDVTLGGPLDASLAVFVILLIPALIGVRRGNEGRVKKNVDGSH